MHFGCTNIIIADCNISKVYLYEKCRSGIRISGKKDAQIFPFQIILYIFIAVKGNRIKEETKSDNLTRSNGEKLNIAIVILDKKLHLDGTKNYFAFWVHQYNFRRL